MYDCATFLPCTCALTVSAVADTGVTLPLVLCGDCLPLVVDVWKGEGVRLIEPFLEAFRS